MDSKPTFVEAEVIAKAEIRPYLIQHANLKERLVWQHAKSGDGWLFVVGLLPPSAQSFSEFLKNPCLDDGPEHRARNWIVVKVGPDSKPIFQTIGDPNLIWSTATPDSPPNTPRG